MPWRTRSQRREIRVPTMRQRRPELVQGWASHRSAVLGSLLLLALVAPRNAPAQATEPIQILGSTALPTGLGALYAEVERGNPKVVAVQALVRAAHARVPGASRPPDPQLQLGFMNYELPGLVPMDVIGMTQLQLMQMVPLGGKLGLAGRVAGAQASATRERAQDVVWELRSQTAMAFYDLYAIDQQFVVARETLRLLQGIAR